MENELKLLKIILRADLSKQELKILTYLIDTDKKTIKTSNPEMALACGITPANFRRALKNLELKQVVAKRDDGIFVKSSRYWKIPK